jgi:hypothetical protein
MKTAYCIQAHNKFYIVNANTKRFTKAIADIFINALFTELMKKHSELTPDLIYKDMIKNKRYFKVSYEYKPNMDTGNGTEPRYYINTKSMISYLKPEQFIVIE